MTLCSTPGCPIRFSIPVFSDAPPFIKLRAHTASGISCRTFWPLYIFQKARQGTTFCCAAPAQFEEGDVLHWWHESEKGPFGVRTRCSDDFLWLPLAVSKYITVTGEKDLLNQKAPFLTAAPLDPERKGQILFPQQHRRKVYRLRALQALIFAGKILKTVFTADGQL